MFLHLPTGLHEDEPLYSALARSGDALSPRVSRDLLGAAFGGDTMVAIIDLPTRLDAVASRLLCMLGRDRAGAELLLGHTLYPYYAHVVEPAIADRAAASMREKGGSVHGLLGVRASRVPAPSRLRYCPACVSADRAARGHAWWRRCHQLPGVLVCPDHARPLLLSCRQTSSARDRLAFHSLDRSAGIGDLPCIPSGGVGSLSDGALAIAARSAELMAQGSAGNPPLGIETLWRRREQALRAAGFGRGSRQISVDRLRRALIETLGSDLLGIVGCRPGADGADDWVARMSRPPRRACHPLYHVLLATLLDRLGDRRGPSDHEAMSRDGAEPPLRISVGSAMAGSAGDGCVGEPIWEARLVALVGDAGRSLRSIARELGVDPLTVQRHAHRLGAWRPGWTVRPCVLPSTAAASRTSIALGGARARWLALGAVRPRLGRKAMRERDPAAFALLYRRDRGWLERNSPPPGRGAGGTSVDWAARDAGVAAELDAAADRILASRRDGRAVRAATIAREADRLAMVQQQGHRMPLASAVLERRSQDPVWLANERLDRAVRAFAAGGGPAPAASVLAKAAGLNQHRAAQLAPAVAAALDALGHPAA